MNGPMVVSGFTGRMAQAVVEQPVLLKRLDRVRISNGSVLIVTGYHPNRPLNCYSGVLERGQGKEYVFGKKHRPEKLGVVTEDHPALQQNQDRKELKQPLDAMTRAQIMNFVAVVIAGEENGGCDSTTIYEMAKALRAKGF